MLYLVFVRVTGQMALFARSAPAKDAELPRLSRSDDLSAAPLR
jgi:hypothetical protein